MIDQVNVSAQHSSMARFVEGRIVSEQLSQSVFDDPLPLNLADEKEPFATKEKTCKDTKPPCCKTTDTKELCCKTKTAACCEATHDSSPHCCLEKKQSERGYEPQQYLLL
jgi:hypothetical protein